MTRQDIAELRSTTLLSHTIAKEQKTATTMGELTRARALKRKIENNISVLVPPAKPTWTHPDPKDDEETSAILSLRQDKNLKWSEITHILNQKRLDAGEQPANLDPSAIYSRFLQHTTRMPQPVREIGFDARDCVHLRHPEQCVDGASGDISVSKTGRNRIKDYGSARELKANMRQMIGAEAQSELESVEKTEKLVEAVAKVERNFWRLVADEMERMTTRLYEPEELARRYHEI
ncbi:hypothetical protein yc1106_02724 [Curvularia clavata]|uniref:Uncharacterized protein n=1 Tax=Curvularia clavata TaxID=95742 RepID=A0A9Q8Z4C1_CURCL|nr:hypothetical protein yc1106_02724 [Curvularia clavata]